MIDFALVDGDLAVDHLGNFITVSGAECISQMTCCAYKMFIGEYEYNNSLGISWVIAMESGSGQFPVVQYQLQKTTLNLNNYIAEPELKIKNVSTINVDFNMNRQLIINAQEVLANGDVIGINTNV